MASKHKFRIVRIATLDPSGVRWSGMQHSGVLPSSGG